jgi:hypothetical protein
MRVPEPPTLAELDASLQRACSPWRVVEADGGDYEQAVANGRIPTRAGSWHDAFNVFVFSRFPTAKASLHRRMLALRIVRLTELTARGRRSREEDALALLDECTLLFGGTADALERFAAARSTGELARIDAVVNEERLVVACFGHALLEHRVLRRPPIGAGVVALPIAEPGVRALDASLAAAIDAGRFHAPCFTPTLPWPDPCVEAWLSNEDRGPRPG